MTTIPRDLSYEILIGCTWTAVLSEHVRKGDVFRVLRKDGSVFLCAARILPDVVDAGVYIASANGGENGVHFEVVQAVTVMVSPVVDMGD